MVLELSRLEVEIDRDRDPFEVAEDLNKSSDPMGQLILVLKKLAELFRKGEIHDGLFLIFLDQLGMELEFDCLDEIDLIFALAFQHDADIDDILRRIDELPSP